MTAFDHIYLHGNNHHLDMHFGNRDTTLVVADRWIVASPEDNRARRPDLLIAFNVSPEDYAASNGYIISEQGNPPDFVMEVASESTVDVNTGSKRADYAALGILEYWRFDKTGNLHGAKLAVDILAGNSYSPIPIEEVSPGILQGYSPALNLIVRWDHEQLVWWDLATEAPIPTYEDQLEGRIRAETRLETERDARTQAEEGAQQLEGENRRLRGA